jgi:hypothetical protein
MDDVRDWIGAALLWLLMLPGVLPLLSLAVLVFGFRRAPRVRRPVLYRFGVIIMAAALIGFSLAPTCARHIHSLQPEEEWLLLLACLAVPFGVLLLGLQIMTWADTRS